MTVVVMTRDRWSDLRTTLPRHDPPVILVDNGSTDGTPELVREHFPHIEVVELGENHGSQARNIGVERRGRRTSRSPTTTPGGSRARSTARRSSSTRTPG